MGRAQRMPVISEDSDDDDDEGEQFTGGPAALMGTQVNRVGTEVRSCLGTSASLMETQSDRESKGESEVLSHGSLGMFLTIMEHDTISNIQEDGWEEVNLVVDSGASETVIGPNMVESAEVKEGRAYRQGVKYEVANGIRIPNLGEKKFSGVSNEGFLRDMTAQVCGINKGLLSVSKLVEKGNRVVFDKSGSYIQNQWTGEKMKLKAERGLFMLQLWTRAASEDF